MRRASKLLLSSYGRKPTTIYQNLRRPFAAAAAISRPRSDPLPAPFPKCSPMIARSFSSGDAPPVPFLHRSRRRPDAADLEEAFESATSTEEILSAFAALEASMDPGNEKLGLACLKVGQHLDSSGSDDLEKVLDFASRALQILDSGDGPSISVAMSLHLLGSVNYNMKRFNDSLGFLNRANRILSSLEREGSCDFDVRPVVHAVQLQLANTKTAMGRREEAIANLRKCLELKASILDPDSRELGTAHRNLAEAYVAVLNFKEALPLGLKALEIHEAQLGSNSVEVAHDRRLLGVIYTGLEQHEKALEQNELSQRVLKNWGMGSEVLDAEVERANIQIALGKFDEAISSLKEVIQKTEENSETRALVFVSMSKALCSQEKFAEAKRCLEVSVGILRSKERASPSMVADAYVEISTMYESMNEIETALSLLKDALSILERLPQEQHMEGNVSAKIGWLLLLTGKLEDAISYLESAAERMKESFGPKHFGVGYIYNNLGAAYMEMGRPHSAAQMFALAKDIMEFSLGPHHADSIEACQSLANAYKEMGSYVLALEFQSRVVDAWTSHGPSAKDELREASRILDELKKKTSQSLSEAILKQALPMESGGHVIPTKDATQ